MKKTISQLATLIVILAMVMGFLPAGQQQVQAAGSISLAVFDSAYTENFDTLTSTGTSSTVPTGWEFLESGTSANSIYTAGTGSSTTGDTYSFGAASSTERAFGGLLSGSVNPTIGAQFSNGTGGTITTLAISYTGEQWRYGGSAVQDRIDFQYSLDATSLSSGSWTDVDALDFYGPYFTGTAVALDGNAEANRLAVSGSLTGLNILNGATFWVRWTDFNKASSDDGLAVDDFSITPSGFIPTEDTAPGVGSTDPVNGATTVPMAANLTVNFSEPVNLADGWYSLSCSTSGPHSAAVSGGPAAYTINPDSDFVDGDVCTLTITDEKVSDQDTNDPPDNMVADYLLTFTVVDLCSQTYTPIYSIQGSGATAGITGDVITKGVVTGDYELPAGTGQLRGFYIQDTAGDGDGTTSDGVFVYNAGRDYANVGDLVMVNGTASEYNGQTQISMLADGFLACGSGTITPTDISFPVPVAVGGVDYLERFEGMLVRVPQTMYVTEHFQLGRFGQITLSSGGRLSQPTNVVTPGAPALALQAENNLRRIILDDADNLENVDPIVFGRGGMPLSASNTLRGGDTVVGISGVLDYTWGGKSASPNAYRIRPVNAMGGSAYFEPVNARPVSAPDVGGNVKVVGMNALNYFNSITGCTLGVGGGSTDCRGADSTDELNRQVAKLIASVLKMNPDVMGFTELENDGYGPESAIADLVNRLNTATAPGTYAFIDADANTAQTNALGTDAIKVGLIYKAAIVTPIGQTAVLNTLAFVNGGDAVARNRPSLAQAFELNSNGAKFIVDVNHLKSKGSACTLPDQGDGQGNCNNVRVNAVDELIPWLASDPTGVGDMDVLIIGDLNAYAMEDPITHLQDAGYTDLIKAILGADAYSYVFDGQWGYLDHTLASSSLLSQIAGVGDYHIDADEPSALDYNTEFKTAGQLDSLYDPDEFRTSDHDPVIIGLNLASSITVDAGGPYTVDEGKSVSMTAHALKGNGSAITYQWDLDNDGIFETPGQEVVFQGKDGPAEFAVKVQATDGTLTGTDSTTVTVMNVAPTVNKPVANPNPSTTGVGLAATATFMDPPGEFDAPYTCTVNYGDGSGIMPGVADATSCEGPLHVYTKSGAFTITVKVTDQDGAVGTNSVIHNVKARAPKGLWPKIATTMVTPKFIWARTLGETKYQIQVRTAAGVLKLDKVISTPTCGATTCWYTPTSTELKLIVGTSYKWKVRSFKAVWSAYGPFVVFKALNPPKAITPSGIIKESNPKFTWGKTLGATKYTLVLQTAAGKTIKTMDVNASACGVSTCSYTFPVSLNLAKGDYKWRVRAFNGYWGPYSMVYMTFTKK